MTVRVCGTVREIGTVSVRDMWHCPGAVARPGSCGTVTEFWDCQRTVGLSVTCVTVSVRELWDCKGIVGLPVSGSYVTVRALGE